MFAVKDIRDKIENYFVYKKFKLKILIHGI
jgi:hypothetical protein